MKNLKKVKGFEKGAKVWEILVHGKTGQQLEEGWTVLTGKEKIVNIISGAGIEGEGCKVQYIRGGFKYQTLLEPKKNFCVISVPAFQPLNQKIVARYTAAHLEEVQADYKVTGRLAAKGEGYKIVEGNRKDLENANEDIYEGDFIL